MIVDLPIGLKLLLNFSKQASSVIAADFYESDPLFRLSFRNFCKFQVIRVYLGNLDANL